MSSTFNQFERDCCMITIGGVTMTTKEYNTMKKKSQAKSKKEKTEKMIKTLSPYINKLIKNVKVLKSAAAYYDNGYRQWGVICRDIINHPCIKHPFVKFRKSAYDISNLMNDIELIGKKNEKDIFQFIEKLSYKVDDAKTFLGELVRGVCDSRVCEFYANEKCINETGRRLGLAVLMEKTMLSMSEIQTVINELDNISRTGVDVMDYNGNNNKRYYAI